MIPLRRLVCLSILSLSLVQLGYVAEAQQFMDDAGRDVPLAAAPERVFAAGPPAAVLLYILKPDAMIGWVRAPRGDDLDYLRPKAAALPELGRLTGRGDTLNLEVLLEADPDLILDYGTQNDTYRDLADRVHQQTGIPYALIGGGMDTLPDSLRRAADILAVPERGEVLAQAAQVILDDADALVARVPANQRPTVYLARGPEGLESPARGSINAEIIERMGAVNVVVAETPGLVTASPEQILAWSPEVIITLDAEFARTVSTKSEWQAVPAVRDGKVYLAPAMPFGFVDSPPSVNRLAGLIWLGHVLYPESVQGDLREAIRTFYTVFYGMSPDDEQLSVLLDG